MKILKIAIGDEHEAFIESQFTSGVNIISSDDNNKGKTIIIQSLLYALGSESAFPASLEYKKYYYYIEFEIGSKMYIICRHKNSFILKDQSKLIILDSVAELKRYWNKNISSLPTIVKNQISRIVDPVLYLQLFTIGQDKKDTSNISHHGQYNKQDFMEMLYSLAGLGNIQLSISEVEFLKKQRTTLLEELKTVKKQHKILSSKKTTNTYFSAESDRVAFGEKVKALEKVQNEILNLNKLRTTATTRKQKWESTLKELKSLNRNITCGELRCMDCHSTNIAFCTGGSQTLSYTFDVATIETRQEIILSITDKIDAYAEEIDAITRQIQLAQENLNTTMQDDTISLESIVIYKEDIFSAADAEKRLQEIHVQLDLINSKLQANETASSDTKEARELYLSQLVALMNQFYKLIDPAGNITYTNLFTSQNEVYSGSEATVFHLTKLFAIQQLTKHSFPLIIDSFRAEDLSTTKESAVLTLTNQIHNQIICTTTLKEEELGKYDNMPNINHIDYCCHTPSRLLQSSFVADFCKLLNNLSIQF